MEVFKGATSQSWQFYIIDSTTGAAKTGLLYSAVTAGYVRTRSARVAITTATLASPSSAFSAGGFIEVDATNAPGLYRFDVPDAAFATGANEVAVVLIGTGWIAQPLRFTLVDWNKQIASVPNAVAGAQGGLPVLNVDLLVSSNMKQINGNTASASSSVVFPAIISSVTEASIWSYLTSAATTVGSIGKWILDKLDTNVGSRMATFTQPTGFLAATFPTTVASPTNITAGTLTTVTNLTNLPTAPTDWLSAAAVSAGAVSKVQNGLATPTNITAGTITTVTNLTNAPTSGDLTATMKNSVRAAVEGDIH